MADENKEYDLDNFDSEIEVAPNRKLSEDTQNEVDYGDGFDTQTGEDSEKHNPDEYYVGKPMQRSKKKENSRKVKNAVIIACIAVVCILVVFAFALTKCSVPKIELSTTTAPTIPTRIHATESFVEEETPMQTEDVQSEEQTQYIEATTEAQEYTEDLTEPVTEVEQIETQVVTEEITEVQTEAPTELPDPEVEDYEQDLDY